MQVGDKGDETGWAVYDACLAAGGIVATAHEHSWSRTYLMRNFRNEEVVHRDSHMEIGPGRSFAFVSGLGGRSIRPQQREGDERASVYTASQDATHGALFCTFENADARCEFKDIAGGVPDAFTLESRIVPGEPTAQAEAPVPGRPGAAPATSGNGAFGPLGLILLTTFWASGFVTRLRARNGGGHRLPGRGDARIADRG